MKTYKVSEVAEKATTTTTINNKLIDAEMLFMVDFLRNLPYKVNIIEFSDGEFSHEIFVEKGRGVSDIITTDKDTCIIEDFVSNKLSNLINFINDVIRNNL